MQLRGPWMTRTPSTLLERLRQPFDPEAWARFVSLYAPLLYAWGRRVGLQDEDAADLVQEVLVTLLQVLPTFTYDRHRSFRGWLRTIALNKWRNARKQPDRRVQLRPGDDLEALAGAAEPEAFWEADYRRHLAGRALAVMRADFQETTWRA